MLWAVLGRQKESMQILMDIQLEMVRRHREKEGSL